MRAGQLNERVVFKRLTTITNPQSGATSKAYVLHLSTRAAKRKLSASVGNGVNVSEEFIASTLVIQVRFNPSILETDRVEFNGRNYSITLLDKQKDNTLLITLKKLNT